MRHYEERTPIRTLNRGGQKIREYEDYLIWELSDGLFRKAGRLHWEPHLEENGGEEKVPGIGFNESVLEEAMANDKLFIVENQKQDELLLLQKMTAREKIREGIYGKKMKLIVLPLSCFRSGITKHLDLPFAEE